MSLVWSSSKLSDELFNDICEEYQTLCTLSEPTLQTMLVMGRLPPAENFLQAVLGNLRRVYGPEVVTLWLEHCAEIGLIV